MKAAYGWTVTDVKDRFVNAMIEGLRIGYEATRPGRWLVDTFPICECSLCRDTDHMVMSWHAVRFVPSWFPGAGFKRQAIIWQTRLRELESAPHEWAKQQIVSMLSFFMTISYGFCCSLSPQLLMCRKASGNYVESFTSQNLQPEDNHSVNAEEESIIKYCSLALYTGGTDTVSLLSYTFK